MIGKAVAAVVRAREGGHDLLVFRHPLAGVQVPKGTIEPGESPAAAALRELAEESGLALDAEPDLLGTWERRLARGEVHLWQVFLLIAPPGLPDRWRHAACGSPEEDGLVFDYCWLPIDGDLTRHLADPFETTARLVLSRFRLPQET